jgi:histidinol phosphatase-like PHP family hydrolase
MNTADARFSFDHDLHIHSHLSAFSSDPEQSTQRILRYAIDEGLSMICVTDHYWDSAIFCPSFWYAPQNYEHVAESLPLPQSPDVRFLFGCETEMDSDFEIGIPLSRFDDFDFVIIPTTHLHMTGHVITEKDAASLESRARLWVERLDALLDKPLPFHKIGIAHLACRLIAPSSHEDYLKTLDMIPTKEMERLFRKAARLGVGIELNSDDMRFSDEDADTVLRMFRVAKAQGCRFYLGSDAHHPDALLKAREIFERAIELLDLRASDKFQFCSKNS